MSNIKGQVYNISLKARWVQNVIDENNRHLKFSYNFLTETISIVHNPSDFNVVEVHYLP